MAARSRIRCADGDFDLLAPDAAPSLLNRIPRGRRRLCHFRYRIVAAMTISLDAIFRRLRSPATNEKADDGSFLEIFASCDQFLRLAARDHVLRTVAFPLQTTSGKPVLQASS
jgi:hypothetical protein